MPILAGGLAAIFGFLSRVLVWLGFTYLGQWVLRALVTMGLTIATTKVSLPLLMSFVQNYVGGLPADLYQTFGAIGGDVVVTMILSAFVARAVGNVALRAVTRA